jgi:hypothetical protein
MFGPMRRVSERHVPSGLVSGTASGRRRSRLRRTISLCAIGTFVLWATAGSALAGSLPSGDRTFHGNRVDAAYNAANPGQLGFFMEPAGQANAAPAAWAPIYVVVYPTGSTAATTFNCMHFGQNDDNCPSHGDTIAGLAAARVPAVYGAGVAGLDHVLDFPGGDDFNIAWEPVAVLFTSKTAANEHVLSDNRILELRAAGEVTLIPLPAKTFLCAIVPQRIWDMATPVPAS